MSTVREQTESIKQDAYLNIVGLARQHKEEGLVGQAEEYYKQAIALAQNLPSHKNTAAKAPHLEALSELAELYCFQGKEEQSQSLWLEILELGKYRFKCNDILYVRSVLGLSKSYEKLGEIDKAEALYKKLSQEQEKHFGSEDLEICMVLKEMAAFYFRLQKYQEAEGLYLKVLALEEYHLGTCSERINNTVDCLIDIFKRQKKWRLAKYMLERQKDILNILHGQGSLCAVSCELKLAKLFEQTGQKEKAIRSYTIVIQTYIEKFGARCRPVQLLKRTIDELSAMRISFTPDKPIHSFSDVGAGLDSGVDAATPPLSNSSLFSGRIALAL